MKKMMQFDNVQIGDVVIDRVGSKDIKSALLTLKQFLEQRPIDITPLIHSTLNTANANRILHIHMNLIILLYICSFITLRCMMTFISSA